MNHFVKNILLLVVVLVISYFTAEYFGRLYSYFTPLFSRSIFALTEQELTFVTGFPFAYIFFTIIVFKLFGFGNRKKWTGWLLVPPFLFFLSGDLKHIYLPVILALVALGSVKVSRKILKI